MAKKPDNLKRTNKRLFLYCPQMGWYRGFSRRIYKDENGTEYVNMRGYTNAEWPIGRADWYSVETD